MTIEDWLSPDVLKLFVAGCAGSLVSLAMTPITGFKANMLRVLSGSVSAVYLGPVFAQALAPFTASSLGTGPTLGLSGFIVGVSGMAAVTFVQDLVKVRRDGVMVKQRELSTEVSPASRSDRTAADAADNTTEARHAD